MASAPAGSLEFLVDSAGLEGRLEFSPDPSGQKWSLGAAMRLVLDARISGVPQKRVEEILARCARSPGKVSEVLVRGTPPEPPKQEEPEWAELSTPPEAEPYRETALREAAAPAIFRIRVERVSVERVVRKPGPLPFLP
ncbi:MAG TPA: hypothetical protein VLH39_00045, partial [Magnetospirillaceae bacterium]|nr:hypothetical protein [Magnetospirillaceae bacterium]